MPCRSHVKRIANVTPVMRCLNMLNAVVDALMSVTLIRRLYVCLVLSDLCEIQPFIDICTLRFAAKV